LFGRLILAAELFDLFRRADDRMSVMQQYNIWQEEISFALNIIFLRRKRYFAADYLSPAIWVFGVEA